MKRSKSSRKSASPLQVLAPEQLRELKAVAPYLDKKQLERLDREITEMAELLLAICDRLTS